MIIIKSNHCLFPPEHRQFVTVTIYYIYFQIISYRWHSYICCTFVYSTYQMIKLMQHQFIYVLLQFYWIKLFWSILLSLLLITGDLL